MNQMNHDQEAGFNIAVIGMVGRFPGAKNIEQFWENLKAGKESITFYSDEELLEIGIIPEVLENPNYVKTGGGILEDKEFFDASFFGYSSIEAELMDPQIRIFHECCWHALEDSGYNPYTYNGLIGLYAGASSNLNWEAFALFSSKSEILGGYALNLLINRDFLCSRVSYILNLKGPSVVVKTACSTSLVAVHMACQAILNGECDMALAGGVTIVRLFRTGYLYQQGLIASSDGHCKAFDAKATGTIGGDGIGLVMLKSLEDALEDGDHIYAVVRGTAINNDGLRKTGFTAPSIDGQSEVIYEAIQVAEVEPETISYVEAHGTGTPVGDPIEIEGLKTAFDTEKKQYCRIGSVKTNIGHLDSAAGVAGLIKTVLALTHCVIPPTLHYQKANPNIDFENSPFFVNAELTEWESNESHPRRAGISSFGIGGTNAHIILEESPEEQHRESESFTCLPPLYLILLSANTKNSLQKRIHQFADFFKHHPKLNLSDVAYTLQLGRKHFPYKHRVVGSDVNEIAEKLQALEKDEKWNPQENDQEHHAVFMFPGQGSQYVNMGLDLYKSEPVFREEINRCFEILRNIVDDDIKTILYPPLEQSDPEKCSEKINHTEFTQPILFIFEYSLAKLLISWGIKPYAMIGHSIGEFTAACVSGVYTLEDTIKLVVNRGKLIQGTATGSMLSIPLSMESLEIILGEYGDPEVCIAAINSTSRCVVSGPDERIEKLKLFLKEKGYETRILHTSHAFHSKSVEPILEEFGRIVGDMPVGNLNIPYISNVTGQWIREEDIMDPNYYLHHLRGTVRFSDGISELLKMNNPNLIFIEVGPGNVLSKFVNQHRDFDKKLYQKIVNLIRHPQEQISDQFHLLEKIGHLWCQGIEPDWKTFYSGKSSMRVPLPLYPFEKKKYWIDEKIVTNGLGQFIELNNQQKDERLEIEREIPLEAHIEEGVVSETEFSLDSHENEVERELSEMWKTYLGVDVVGRHDNFFDLGGDSLLAVQLIAKVNSTFQMELSTHILLEKNTISALAELISSGDSQENTLLVELNKGKSGKNPVFIIHPIGGHVYFYRDLVREMDPEQPIYGIIAPGLDTEAPRLTSIPQLAELYIEEIQQKHPKGSYCLGGASFGGIVAFEMAQQLVQQQQEIELLFMIDSPGPGQMPERLQDDSAILAYIIFTMDREIQISPDKIRPMDSLQLKEFLIEQGGNEAKNNPDAYMDEIYQRLKVYKSLSQGMYDYIPQRYPGFLHYFRATERMENNTLDPVQAWLNMATKGIQSHTIPGDHISMNNSPNVKIIADVLSNSITE
jgi:phthiocerol/phenolphthiocerol synthesis type-I polyketide synthase E